MHTPANACVHTAVEVELASASPADIPVSSFSSRQLILHVNSTVNSTVQHGDWAQPASAILCVGEGGGAVGAAWCTRFPFLPEPLQQLPDGFEHGRYGRLYSFSDCGWLSDLSRVIREGSVVSVPLLGVPCVS